MSVLKLETLSWSFVQSKLLLVYLKTHGFVWTIPLNSFRSTNGRPNHFRNAEKNQQVGLGRDRVSSTVWTPDSKTTLRTQNADWIDKELGSSFLARSPFSGHFSRACLSWVERCIPTVWTGLLWPRAITSGLKRVHASAHMLSFRWVRLKCVYLWKSPIAAVLQAYLRLH